jgi:hypothetical protein
MGIRVTALGRAVLAVKTATAAVRVLAVLFLLAVAPVFWGMVAVVAARAGRVLSTAALVALMVLTREALALVAALVVAAVEREAAAAAAAILAAAVVDWLHVLAAILLMAAAAVL